MRKNNRSTSWQKVAPWYSKITEHGQGHYFHQHIIIPKVIRLLSLDSSLRSSHLRILDFACGNGVLAKYIPKNVEYLGIDIAPSLIKEAKKIDKNPNHKYLVADVSSPSLFTSHLSLSSYNQFTHAVIMLALQNIEGPDKVLQNVSKSLKIGGKLVIVLNHPVLRIPRQTSWGIDEARKIQYRRIDRYLSPLKIPINMNLSDKNSAVTWSYHHSLSDYSKMLKDAGFVIEIIEEWTSDKDSKGSAARMENRGRSEFPLFLTIVAKKE